MMISIVSPLHNEAVNVAPLVREIAAACSEFAEFEVLLVDDGSQDGTADRIRDLQGDRSWLRLVSHATAGGQSAAVHSGVLAARGAIVATLDGDLQNPPAEIPKLVAPLLSGPPELGLVAGQRVARQDSLSKRLGSRFANRLRSWLLKDGTRDTGCGLKAFRRDAFLALPYFDHMHRYLPALFKGHGWAVAHVDVAHRARAGGRSKYSNLQRAAVGLYDLIGVAWLLRRAKKVRPVQDRPAGAGDKGPIQRENAA